MRHSCCANFCQKQIARYPEGKIEGPMKMCVCVGGRGGRRSGVRGIIGGEDRKACMAGVTVPICHMMFSHFLIINTICFSQCPVAIVNGAA